MYKHILIPMARDHAPHTAQAVDVARKLLDSGGLVSALTVIEPTPAYVAQYLPENILEHTREEIALDLTSELSELSKTQIDVVSGQPGRAIVDYAAANGVDCIIIASHRPGLQDYFLGSTAARVVRHAPCAVHVLR